MTYIDTIMIYSLALFKSLYTSYQREVRCMQLVHDRTTIRSFLDYPPTPSSPNRPPVLQSPSTVSSEDKLSDMHAAELSMIGCACVFGYLVQMAVA